MIIDNLYISHQNFNFNSLPDLKILDLKNLKNLKNGNYITSIEDITFGNIDFVLDSSKKIHLIDLEIDKISLTNENSAAYARLFCKLSTIPERLSDASSIKKINLDLLINNNTDRPKTKCLFAHGCSITFGIGVGPNKKYTSIVSEKLKIPLVDMSCPGASIFWSADSILRSNLKPDDIVIWGITNIPRVSIYDGLKLKHLTTKNYMSMPKSLQYWNLDYFHSTTQSIAAISCIEQVKNFCNKLSVNLLLVNILETTWIPLMYGDDPNYIDLCLKFYNTGTGYTFIDMGNDGEHPGENQHLYYAQEILKRF
jgi:hypothetical protein